MFLDENSIYGLGGHYTEPNTKYDGGIGLQIEAIESHRNEMIMFEAMLLSDAKEISLREDSYELASFQEGVLGDIWAKVKKLWEKIKTKIKGVWHNFVARFSNWMGKNGYAYYKKYYKDIARKDCSKLKVRYSEPTGKTIDFPKFDTACEQYMQNVGQRINKEIDHENEVLSLLKATGVPCSDVKDFINDAHEYTFDDEDSEYEVGNKKDDMLEPIANEDLIKRVEKGIKEVDRLSKNVDKALDSQVKAYRSDTKGKKLGDQVTFSVKNDDGSTTASMSGTKREVNKAIAAIQISLSTINEALNKVTSSELKETKFAVGQARRVMAAMIVFNPKKHINDSYEYDLSQLVQEAAEEEVYSELEAL